VLQHSEQLDFSQNSRGIGDVVKDVGDFLYGYLDPCSEKYRING